MASPNIPVTADTLITIKLQYGNEHKRTKLPFKDMKPDVLPAKLRALLALPTDQKYIFERWSDSSGSYVKLDPTNHSVYKQLNRAARAKGKLRIKISVVESEQTKARPLPGVNELLGNMSANDLDLAGLHISPAQPSQPADKPSALRPYTVPAQHQEEEGEEEEEDVMRRRLQTRMMGDQMATVNDYLDEFQQTMAQDYAKTFGAKIPAQAPEPMAASLNSLPIYPSPPYNLFSVCCNKCGYAVPDHHWHCNVCEEGDFDLCQTCLDAGAHCNDPQHFLKKRIVEDGKIMPITSEIVSKTRIGGPQQQPQAEASNKEVVTDVPGAFNESHEESSGYPSQSRTCNSCISIYDDSQFVTCKDCEDYDLCVACHLDGKHGHHPGHTFAAAVEDMILEDCVAAACEPGRDYHHDAICDGCDLNIVGVRHKCLECPDWDYCSTCYKSAHFIHPGHRFAPVYADLGQYECRGAKNDVHVGVRCDGPLCAAYKRWIVGDRFKCAICDDTDFCASCEALPTNPHNRTHPMIKFRAPIKDVSITTYHEAEVVGDRKPQTSSRGTETMPTAPSTNASTQVQAENASAEKDVVAGETVEETVVAEEKPSEQVPQLDAFYIRDYISDGTKVFPGQSIYQSWTLYNPSATSWPQGCALRWAGGDHMIDVDLDAPGSVEAFEAASMSNATHAEVNQGGEYSFSVKLRAPQKTGRAVSYWRLYSPDGKPFGHRLWCDVDIVADVADAEEPVVKSEKEPEQLSESQMVFPKLEKESPAASQVMSTSATASGQNSKPSDANTHVDKAPKAEVVAVTGATSPIIAEEAEEFFSQDDVESVAIDLEYDDDETDDGFLTDEDYDMLEDDMLEDAAH